MAKAKKKQEEKIERNFVVGLKGICNLPRPRRANKAIAFLKKFAFKHFRAKAENVSISNKLNEFVWQQGREHVPRKVEIKIVFTGGKASLFLKGEKVKIPKEEKKGEKKKEKTGEEKKEEEEKEKKKEEKKMAEKSAEKAAIKRGKE